MKRKLLAAVATLLLTTASGAPPFVAAAEATTYDVTFENVLIDNNPNYTVTGSFFYDSTQLTNPFASYGLSNFNVNVVSPYGTFQMNTLLGTDSAFDYFGLGISNSSTTPALMFILSLSSNGNGTGLNLLDQAANNSLPLPLVTNGQSDFIPGRSVLVPSTADLFGINYSGFGPGNWPAASNAFPTVSGSLVASAVPLKPSIWANLIFGFLGFGWIAYRRKKQRAPTTAWSRSG
jgi:hypothetical protein